MSLNETISPSEKERAAAYLLDRIPQATFDIIGKREKDGDTSWCVTEHLRFGLTVRNHLRDGGFRWSDITMDNLWHEIVAMAARMAAETPRVSREEALAIVRRKVGEDKSVQIQVFSEMPENCRVYGLPANSNCWFVLVSEGKNGIRPSRLICVSKEDGSIIYDGSAGDEG
jgi:hypothetical protein